ncbi:MAG TPA: AMP-binding protein, partial [Cyclobacteriaceae bacterium]|nr:AMP-binding protein [Cyclobacteriaceae bacterium]
MEQITTPAKYQEVYKKSIEQPEQFWEEIATDFTWRKKWDKVLEWDFKKAQVKWFVGGKLNITENCIDRHLSARSNQTAIIWEPSNPEGEAKHITYKELHEQVCRVGNMLKANGIKKGDRICIYMPMVPELAYAILGCARIGAVHSVVFAGFSAGSLVDRIKDSDCKLVLTADGAIRGDKKTDLKSIIDEALTKCPGVKTCIMLEHTKSKPLMMAGRDKLWGEEMIKVSAECQAEEMDAEDMLFILYTSGSTGKPKGMVHTCGGYMVYVNYTFRTAFQYQEKQVYWCTADVGWITGHSYILYGPLSAGATTVIFEGAPSWPDMGRFWQAIERHKVNIFYTAPTAIRSLQKASLSFVEKYDLSSLKILGSVGEPINEEAWHWYDENIGK